MTLLVQGVFCGAGAIAGFFLARWIGRQIDRGSEWLWNKLGW